MKNRISKIIEEKSQKFIEVANAIWEYAEIKFDVEKSASKHINLLKDEGFEVEVGIYDIQNAFRATYGKGKTKIGILCEYDALPDMSQKADSLTKEPNLKQKNGHGCGHQLIGTAGVAAGISLKEYIKSHESAQIVIFGCPAEEFGFAKGLLARDGAFDDMSALISWHPMDRTMLWDMSSLAVYQAFFNFKGISSHAGANPELGRSALDAAELMNIGVQFLREHIIDEARVHYAFTDVGGSAANVVQPTASLHYVIRAPKQNQVDEIYKRVCKIAQGAALMSEVEVEIKLDSTCADYMVNKTLGEVMYKNMQEIFPINYTDEEWEYEAKFAKTIPEINKKSFHATIKKLNPSLSEEQILKIAQKPLDDTLYPPSYPQKPLTASTDVGDASWCAPTVQLMVATFPQGLPPHSWQWVAMGKAGATHKAMFAAAKSMAFTAYDLFENPEILEKAKKEHKENLGGFVYKNPIPKENAAK